MGRIYDALRRAEREREGDGPMDGRPEPAVMLDVAAPQGFGRVEPTFAPDGQERDSRAPAAGKEADPTARASGAPTPDASLVAVAAPSSPAAEDLRAIKARLAAAFVQAGYRTLLVTSPGRGDGKTMTASNLALLLAAEIDRRVLLVDGDLRQPRLHQLFRAERMPGLSDAALGRVPWARCVRQAPWNGLEVLPAGIPVRNPAELLNGPGARQLFGELREAFDFLVVDSTPALSVADAGILATLADGVLLVVRSEHTPRQAILDAVERLGDGRVVGVVLNAVARVPFERHRYYTY